MRHPRMGLHKRHRGFTLIELLLVVAIIGVTTLVSVPYFVKSMRGNRLRAAGRTIVMMERYARSMAVLHQREVALSFGLTNNEIRVQFASPPPPTAAPAATNMASPPIAPGLDPALSGGDEPPPPSTGGAGAAPDRQRILDGVTIEALEFEDADPKAAPSSTVIYRINGTCAPHQVRILDAYGSRMRIEVDSLGSARTTVEAPP